MFSCCFDKHAPTNLFMLLLSKATRESNVASEDELITSKLREKSSLFIGKEIEHDTEFDYYCFCAKSINDILVFSHFRQNRNYLDP